MHFNKLEVAWELSPPSAKRKRPRGSGLSLSSDGPQEVHAQGRGLGECPGRLFVSTDPRAMMHALCFNRVSYAGKRVSSEAKPLPRGVGATLELTWSFARLSLRHFFHHRPRLHCFQLASNSAFPVRRERSAPRTSADPQGHFGSRISGRYATRRKTRCRPHGLCESRSRVRWEASSNP